MLVGLEDDDWSPELLALFDIPAEILPAIRPCDAVGATLVLEGAEVPLVASSYDMGLALLGHGCLADGDTKATFGTCLGVMAATDQLSRAPGLLTTIAYERAGAKAWALDGEIASAGALVNWALRAGLAESLAELEQVAATVPDSRGVVLVPAIQGLGAPHWRDDVRAAFVGMTEETGRPHLARAVFDAIAWSLHDVIEALATAGRRPRQLSVDGGLTHSRPLLQRCADTLQIPLQVASHVEATAYGAAALAMLATGVAGPSAIRTAIRTETTVEPGTAPAQSEREAWGHALATVLGDGHGHVAI
jgi:glycerol kinase